MKNKLYTFYPFGRIKHSNSIFVVTDELLQKITWPSNGFSEIIDQIDFERKREVFELELLLFTDFV